MRRILTILLGLLLTPVTSQAECDCLWQGSFDKVQAETDLILSATVISRRGNSIDVSIDRALRGGRGQETLRVWLKAADYCRPPASEFPPDSQWLMALHEIKEDVPGGFNPNTPNVSYGRVGDYFLSSCGGYWLSRKGDWVSGNLVGAPRWEREPPMTPVLIDLIEDFVNGRITREALLQASRVDPAVRELILDTRAFLRGDPPED